MTTPNIRTVELFGTLERETRRAYLFQCEDQGEPVWIGKSIADWHDDTDSMTVPRWLARKHRWTVPEPADDDPVWQLVIAAAFRPDFYATSIRRIRQPKDWTWP